MDQFPLTPNGKIDKNAFAEPNICFNENLEKGNTLVETDIKDNSIEDQIRKILVENVTNGTSIERIGLNDELTKYGIDSVTYVKIVIAVEAIFEIEFDDEYLIIEEIKYFRNLLHYVKRKI